MGCAVSQRLCVKGSLQDEQVQAVEVIVRQQQKLMIGGPSDSCPARTAAT